MRSQCYCQLFNQLWELQVNIVDSIKSLETNITERNIDIAYSYFILE